MKGEPLTRTFNASTVFFKSLFGAGVLALPHAFATVGLPLALCVYVVVCLLCCGTVWLLLMAKQYAVELGAKEDMTFQDVSVESERSKSLRGGGCGGVELVG